MTDLKRGIVRRHQLERWYEEPYWTDVRLDKSIVIVGANQYRSSAVCTCALVLVRTALSKAQTRTCIALLRLLVRFLLLKSVPEYARSSRIQQSVQAW